MTNRDKTILTKVLDEIGYLETSTTGFTFESFVADETLKRAACMTLINIGELCRLLSEEVKAKAQDIPFNEIIATRNVTAHGYQTLRFDDVWSTIQADIPELKIKIATLLGTGNGANPHE